MSHGLPIVGPLERALYLRSLSLFHDLGATELAACAQLTQERYLGRGEIVYEERSRPNSVYLLVDGRVRLESGGRFLRHLEASDDVGLVELLANQAHGLRAVAETNALALVIDGASLLDLMEEHFSFFLQIRHALGLAVARQQHASGSYYTSPPAASASPAAPSDGSNGTITASRPPLDLAEQLLALQRTAAFRDVGLAILAALISEENAIHVEPGATLWERGADPACLALITEGLLVCTPENEHHAFRAGPGVLLGVDATFGDTPYAYRAVAEAPVTATCIDTRMLVDMAEDHFDLASRMLAHGACELLRLQELAAKSPNPVPASPSNDDWRDGSGEGQTSGAAQ